MPVTAYRKSELYDRPAVTADQAAANKVAAKLWNKAGNPCKPTRPRPSHHGLFRVSRSTFDKWVKEGVIPKPKKIGRVVMWPAPVIHEKLRELGLPVPGEQVTSD